MSLSDDKLAKIAEILRDLFDEYEGEITPATSAADVEQWDSLANVQLMVMVEGEFGIRFSTSEIQNFQNVGDMIASVERHAAA